MAFWLCGAFYLPSVFRVGVHDTYFQFPVSFHCFAEFRHFQQAPGVGNDEDSVKAGPHPADFVDQSRHINGRGFPDGSAADTLPDKPLTGPPPYRAEREYLLQVSACPRHGDDSRNDDGTPAQPQLAHNGGGSVRTAVGVKLT